MTEDHQVLRKKGRDGGIGIGDSHWRPKSFSLCLRPPLLFSYLGSLAMAELKVLWVEGKAGGGRRDPKSRGTQVTLK